MELSPEAQRLAVIVVAVVVLWVTEALPLAVTALLGAVACVLAGVAPAKEVFRAFADPLIFLFIGSFLLAEAIRLHGLDRRLAFGVLSVPWVGERPRRILAAVAAVTVLISAFISNTCTAAMMVAIVTGILAAVEDATRRAEEASKAAAEAMRCVGAAEAEAERAVAAAAEVHREVQAIANKFSVGALKLQLNSEIAALEVESRAKREALLAPAAALGEAEVGEFLELRRRLHKAKLLNKFASA